MTEHNYQLPKVRGQYRFDAPLAKTNWFGVGGNAQVLFKPEDTQDLADFMRQLCAMNAEALALTPKSEGDFGPLPRERLTEQASLLGHALPSPIPVTVIGVGSNLIVRDGGLPGVVIRLGRFFNEAKIDLEAAADGSVIVVGAAMLDLNLARLAASWGRAGLEFMSGIPGTVGGALAMNAGAYAREVKDVLVKAEAVTPAGEMVVLTNAEMKYSYRHYGGPEGLIFTRGWFATTADDAGAIEARMAEIQAKREATQPIRERTGGSTFANPVATTLTRPSADLPPEGGGMLRAWELIDAAGCRGLKIGGAQMSEQHCNFMINTGGATAADLEALGEEVRARVKAQSGVELRWEIKRVGRTK